MYILNTELSHFSFFPPIIYSTVTFLVDVQMICVFNIFLHILWGMDVIKCQT